MFLLLPLSHPGRSFCISCPFPGSLSLNSSFPCGGLCLPSGLMSNLFLLLPPALVLLYSFLFQKTLPWCSIDIVHSYFNTFPYQPPWMLFRFRIGKYQVFNYLMKCQKQTIVMEAIMTHCSNLISQSVAVAWL